MATKQVGYYVPKKDAVEVEQLLAYHRFCSKSYYGLSCEYSRLNSEYTAAIEEHRIKQSEATNANRLEAQSKWQDMGILTRCAWTELCTVIYKLSIQFGITV